MSDEPNSELGQRANAARAHRLLVCFFALCALFYLGAWASGVASVGFKIITCIALAAANHLVAAAARQQQSWAQTASLILAGLILALGAVLFFTRPDIQAFLNTGHAGAAFAGSFAVVLAVVQMIAAAYIFLNGNWQQPVPPDERPDSSMRP